jgi:hypothetical protein
MITPDTTAISPEVITNLDGLIHHTADALMTDALLALRVHELVGALKQHSLAQDDQVMLSTLESLVMAGEITLYGFLLRLQNLFPEIFDQLDPKLRAHLHALRDSEV